MKSNFTDQLSKEMKEGKTMKKIKPKAIGIIKKTETGSFTVTLWTGHPDEASSYQARARKRMKDAISDCNKAAVRLGWDVQGYSK